MKFYIGLHHASDAYHFEQACISVRTIWKRKKSLSPCKIFLDSGAFTEISTYGSYQKSVKEYADTILRLNETVCDFDCVVSQDYMCEPFILNKTGLTVKEHQKLTIERYFELIHWLGPVSFPVIPVLQGFEPEEYLEHIEMYGNLLKESCWTGVGSVCKRQGKPKVIIDVVKPILQQRPDLKLHGFGVKVISLLDPTIRNMFYSADSNAWSFAARKQGRDAHDWREAKDYEFRINNPEVIYTPKPRFSRYDPNLSA